MNKFDELSEQDLDRIEALAGAASAGPWVSYVAGRNADTDVTCIELGTCNELGTMNCLEICGGSVADQDFIASARQDLPRLLDEVRTLRARLNSLLRVQLESLLLRAAADVTRRQCVTS